jgi:formylglycine-generating enzyme
VRLQGLTALFFLVGCTGEAVTATRDDGGETSAASDSSTAVETTDTSTPSDTTATDVAPGTCPSGRGPDMIYIAEKGYCIDRTEVTEGQYQEFLLVLSKPKADYPICDSRPYRIASDKNLERPAVNVEWCNAHVFCKWAGKRLCGAHGGGAALPSAGPSSSQWIYACRGGDPGTAYPYGDVFNAATCNGDGSGVGSIAAAGGHPDCTPPVGSPAHGVLDMSGSVREWENACDGPIQIGTTCATRGGYYASSPVDQLKCQESSSWELTNRDNTVGFRCCYDGK